MISISLFQSFNPCKNASNNLVAPAKGGAIAMNFFIFFKKVASPFFFNKLVKVKRVPNECATMTTGFPVFLYNLSI